MLCQLATSESDRCLIKYSVSKSQGLSAKEAKKKYGFSDLHRKEDMITKAAGQSEAIRDAVMKLASVRSKATLRSLGYELPGSSSDSEDSDMDQLVSESDVSLNETFKQSDEQENTSENTTTEDVPCVNLMQQFLTLSLIHQSIHQGQKLVCKKDLIFTVRVTALWPHRWALEVVVS